MVGDQTHGIKKLSLRAATRNLKIKDGEDVDVPRRPDFNTKNYSSNHAVF